MARLFFAFSLFLATTAHAAGPSCISFFERVESEAVTEFLSYVTPKTNALEVQLYAEMVNNKHALTFEDFLFINAWKYGNNLSNIALSQQIRKFSLEQPFTAAQFLRFIERQNVDDAVYHFWSLRRPPFKSYDTSYAFAGTNREYIDLLITMRKNLGRNGRSFVRQTLTRSSLDSLASLKLSTEDVTYLLRQLPPRQLNLENLEMLIAAAGFETIGRVKSELLLSRIEFVETNTREIGQWATATALLLTFDKPLLDKFKNDRFRADFPSQLVVNATVAKAEALKNIGIENEAALKTVFTKLWDITQKSHWNEVKELYRLAQVLVGPQRDLWPQADVLFQSIKYFRQDIMIYEYSFRALEARKVFEELLPSLRGVEASAARDFMNLYLPILKARFNEIANLYIYPKSLLSERSFAAAVELLKLREIEGKTITETQIHLYFDLIHGNIIPVPNPNFFQSFMKARLPRLTHEQAIDFIRQSGDVQ